MVACPKCGRNVSKIVKEWNYRENYYRVKMYECPSCKKSFKAYFHDGKFSHTIPKKK